jgi:hypothetical protein
MKVQGRWVETDVVNLTKDKPGLWDLTKTAKTQLL